MGIQIIVTSPTGEMPWENYSRGEAQRLRQALAQGVASLIQRSSGVEWSLEVWDEPCGNLSDRGIENLMETLAYRADSAGKSIWLCDHIAVLYTGFKEVWTAVREPDTGTKFVVEASQ